MNALSVSAIFGMLAYLSLLLGSGYALLCGLIGPIRRHPAEILGLSMMIGCGALPFLFFWLSLAGIQPNRTLLGCLAFLVMISLVRLAQLNRWVLPMGFWPQWARTDWLALAALGLLVWSVGLITYSTFAYPLAEWDAFAIWGFKAKILFSAPLSALGDYFQDRSLGFSHLDYPLGVPFLTTGGYAAMNGVNDTLGKAPGLFLFFGLIVFLYGAMRFWLGRAAALVWVALFASAPIVIRWASVGTADMSLAAFFAGSAYYMTRWLAGGGKLEVRLAAFFCAVCVFTKNEGLAMAVIVFGAALIFGGFGRARARYFQEGFFPVIAALASLLPWVIFRHSLPHIDENYLSHLNTATVTANLPRWRVILAYFYYNTIDPIPYYCLWPLAGAAFLTGLGKHAGLAPLVLLSLLVGLGLADGLAYLISPQPIDELILVTVDRLLLQALPAAILLAASSLAPIFSSRRQQV